MTLTLLQPLYGGGHVSSPLLVLLLFTFYYLMSTLAVVFFLKVSMAEVRTLNSLMASIGANVASGVLSVIILLMVFNSVSLVSTLIFALSNFIFQVIFLHELYGMEYRNSVIPLTIGNSIAYWLVFPVLLNLMH